MTLPSNTLSAAKSVAVPFRLSSCVIVPHRPFFRGRPGWVRSKAWIWLFSSTHNTIPFCGGFKYRPTTSVNFSMNLGSRDSLKVRLRCGLRRSEEHTSELQSHSDLVCRLLLEK